MNADEKYVKAMEKELEAFCNGFFRDGAEMEAYLDARHIPRIALRPEAARSDPAIHSPTHPFLNIIGHC